MCIRDSPCAKWAMLFPVMHECVILLIQLVDEKLKGEIVGILNAMRTLTISQAGSRKTHMNSYSLKYL